MLSILKVTEVKNSMQLQCLQLKVIQNNPYTECSSLTQEKYLIFVKREKRYQIKECVLQLIMSQIQENMHEHALKLNATQRGNFKGLNCVLCTIKKMLYIKLKSYSTKKLIKVNAEKQEGGMTFQCHSFFLEERNGSPLTFNRLD